MYKITRMREFGYLAAFFMKYKEVLSVIELKLRNMWIFVYRFLNISKALISIFRRLGGI